MFVYEDTKKFNSITMEYMPDSVLQIIYNFVPYSSYDYMDGLVGLLVIAEETGVTPLGRLQLERAMRRAYAPMDVDPPLFS